MLGLLGNFVANYKGLAVSIAIRLIVGLGNLQVRVGHRCSKHHGSSLKIISHTIEKLDESNVIFFIEISTN